MAGADCLFCAVVAGSESSQVVVDEPEVLAFLDHRPVFPGHTLVIPRAHYATFTDLPVAICGEELDENCLPAVRAYYADLDAGAEEDAEIKVFVLGN